MALQTEIPELDRKGLRNFGFTTGSIVVVLFGFFFPWLLDRSLPLWPWVILGVLGAMAVVAPMALRPIYRGWMRFGLVLSRITTPLILGIVFFALIWPFGFVRRLFTGDKMARRFEPDSESYRVPSTRHPSKSLERPF